MMQLLYVIYYRALGNMVQLRKYTLDKMLRNYDPNLRPHIIGSAGNIYDQRNLMKSYMFHNEAKS